jgi:hypothetical protein
MLKRTFGQLYQMKLALIWHHLVPVSDGNGRGERATHQSESLSVCTAITNAQMREFPGREDCLPANMFLGCFLIDVLMQCLKVV